MKKNPQKLARICQECDNYYIPTGKFSKLCDYCRGRRYERGLKTRRENKIAKAFSFPEKKVVTFIRHCRHCEEIFKPTSKYNFVCEDCKEKLREKQSEKYKKQRLLKQEQLRKLKVTK